MVNEQNAMRPRQSQPAPQPAQDFGSSDYLQSLLAQPGSAQPTPAQSGSTQPASAQPTPMPSAPSTIPVQQDQAELQPAIQQSETATIPSVEPASAADAAPTQPETSQSAPQLAADRSETQQPAASQSKPSQPVAATPQLALHTRTLGHSEYAEQLRGIIAKAGGPAQFWRAQSNAVTADPTQRDTFSQPQAEVTITTLPMPAVRRDQLLLILHSGAVVNVLANIKPGDADSSNMTVFSNVVHDAYRATGLAYGTLVSCMADLFYASGCDILWESAVSIDANGDAVHCTRQPMSDDDTAKACKDGAHILAQYSRISDSDNPDESSLNVLGVQLQDIATKLCDAAVPFGFFLRGVCYQRGLGSTAVDIDKAIENLNIAAKHGVPEAATLLGDAYFHGGLDYGVRSSYTKARAYYTMPGGAPLTDERAEAVRTIEAQGKENKLTWVFAAVLAVLMVAFIVFFHAGLIGGGAFVVRTILCIVLALLAVGGYAYVYRGAVYDNIRTLIAVLFLIFMLYCVFLFVA